ncbi:MAG TPA: MFS transporter [Nocardioides sp.]|uniref:MFS transporter n=1 Tax=Nocardioides sp. TaxID=35761 RepID=UPI002D80E766|nr:MFS transporter [Nocardioides sp.]HET6651606.1 MFS transporter [Nocardioides sp.]
MTGPTRAQRVLLALAAVAVGFAAADTYVVVLALPDMMTGVGLSIDELQRAAPIVSGFLLGYVAVLPLIGRVADLRGRTPVLVGSLVVFALGSLVTAASYDLPSMVAGRFLQGVGGGGLVPATLALVADLYPPARRGVPLGVVGAVQELGSVVGPLYGALVLAVASWHGIFAINLAAGLVLAAALRSAGRRDAGPVDRPDLVGLALALLAALLLTLVMLQPASLASGVTVGLAFLPVTGESRWLTPLALALYVVVAALVARCLTARRPLVDLRAWRGVAARIDVPGALLLGLALSGVILAFATADPEVAVFSPAGPWLLAGSAVAAVGFGWRNQVSAHPLVPHGALRQTPAWGALLVSFFVGAALIAALVDIPIFARLTVYPDSQLLAALVLVRLLVALPVGALLGGYLLRRVPPGVVTAAGMLLACLGFVWMAQWGLTSLEEPVASVPLVAAGLGFGLALAPVNAALLAATEDAVHGVTSALLVVARMVGMLVGISALTTIGLRRYYAVQVDLPTPSEVCASGTQCAEYTRLLKEAGLAQLQTVFWGAAVCAAVAAVLAVVVFRTARTRDVAAAGRVGFGA